MEFDKVGDMLPAAWEAADKIELRYKILCISATYSTATAVARCNECNRILHLVAEAMHGYCDGCCQTL